MSTTLGKTAPAFMFYASDAIADKRYRLMSLEERGLYLSLLCECWVNRSIPSAPDAISKWLSFDPPAISRALTQRVLSHFKEEGGELVSPDLERYRKDLEERRLKQSKGGKKGAQLKRNKALESTSSPGRYPYEVVQGSRVEKSRAEKSKDESVRDRTVIDPWVSEYELASGGD